MKKYSLYILFLMGLGAMAGSCTNLDEKIYDRLVDNNFYKNEKDIIAAITPVYTDYRGLLEWRKWWDFEETTDVAVTPRAAWFDGGIYIRLHKHTWKPEDPHFSDLWGQAYGGISNCNRVIYQLDNLDFEVTGKESVIAELEVARAYWYYILCEAFGNVPIVDRFDVPEGFLPETSSREEVFAFIENSIKNNVDKLSDDTKTYYGRFNKWNAKMLLANDPMHLGTSPASCLASLPSGAYLSSDKIQSWHNRRFRFNYYAAVATMARVYLWKGDRENALLCAGEVIADQDSRFPWVLKANLSNIGNTSNEYYRNQDRSYATEHIFALNVTDLEDCMDSYIFDGEIGMKNSMEGLEITTDERSQVYENYSADIRYQYGFAEYGNKYLISKFYQNSVTARYFQERVPLIRLSEMYYIAAECAATTSEGVDYLEKVRTNRGLLSYPLSKSMSASELEAEIRKEYKKEFWGEGQLWYYYKRKSYMDFSSYMTNVDFFTFDRPDVEESNAGRE